MKREKTGPSTFFKHNSCPGQPATHCSQSGNLRLLHSDSLLLASGRTRLSWLDRLITSTTFPSSNHVRYKHSNYKEAQGHTHCNRNKKAEVRVSSTFFSCWKRTDRQQRKEISKECNEIGRSKQEAFWECTHTLIFVEHSPYFPNIHPSIP